MLSGHSCLPQVLNSWSLQPYCMVIPIPGFPCGSAGKEPACNVGDLGFCPWVGKIPGKRERLPTPVFWPGESHGLYVVHGVAKSLTRLSDFHFTPVLSKNNVFSF